MRYLGNKESVVNHIINLCRKHGLLDKRMRFFDGFCGTGIVSEAMKTYHNIILNDNLQSSVTYAHGRLVAPTCTFSKLGFDPFSYFASNKNKYEGFIYSTYSPKGGRMYFTESNAARIDFIRSEIENWHENDKITTNEYRYLLACLIEAVSSVSNIAGVYGAYLKRWDSRALKEIRLLPIPSNELTINSIESHNAKIEDIISTVSCDILYLDPPYTQNQYGTQYHLLETLILNDCPNVSKITGSRPTAPMRSKWSQDIWTHILFEKVVAETKAKHIIVSYNDDGFMTKEYISSILKQYGEVSSFDFLKIPYKKYTNHKSKAKKDHFEYLFYIKKKPKEEVFVQSPLNYTGSKAKMINSIKGVLPATPIYHFIDLFGGGFNVGSNIEAYKITYNDIISPVVSLIRMFYEHDAYYIIKTTRKIISQYSLSPNSPEAYLKLREDCNCMFRKGDINPFMFYTLVLHSFQQQIRFNALGEYNNPHGSRHFNDNLLAKLISFCRVINKKKIIFLNNHFEDLLPLLDKDSVVYLDPPYRNTVGVYNDGKRGHKGWNTLLEAKLLKFIDEINQIGARFIFSYLIKTKHEENTQVLSWLNNRNFNVLTVKENQGRYCDREEIIITNFQSFKSL